jgi:hypothetical protein
MIAKSLYPDTAQQLQITGLAKMDGGRFVVRLVRKIDTAFDEFEGSPSGKTQVGSDALITGYVRSCKLRATMSVR